MYMSSIVDGEGFNDMWQYDCENCNQSETGSDDDTSGSDLTDTTGTDLTGSDLDESGEDVCEFEICWNQENERRCEDWTETELHVLIEKGSFGQEINMIPGSDKTVNELEEEYRELGGDIDALQEELEQMIKLYVGISGMTTRVSNEDLCHNPDYLDEEAVYKFIWYGFLSGKIIEI
jgi:hypothetical protein